jgi:hypothetical protein
MIRDGAIGKEKGEKIIDLMSFIQKVCDKNIEKNFALSGDSKLSGGSKLILSESILSSTTTTEDYTEDYNDLENAARLSAELLGLA